MDLTKNDKLILKQVHEIGELFGFETRNKYAILDAEQFPLGYAAEQSKGILGFFLRQFLGHWRKFEVHFFNEQRELVMVGQHPFRWFFERIEVYDANDKFIGAIQKRFAIFTKRFDVEGERGDILYTVASPIWKIWTFNFMQRGRTAASIKKRWTGLLAEAFTDKDTFYIEYINPQMENNHRKVILASSVFIDLLFFERKAN